MTLALGIPAFCRAGESAVTKADIERAVAAIAAYDAGKPRRPLYDVEELIRKAAGRKELSQQIEQELLKVLGAGPSDECKLFICQQLWIIGSDASVPALQKLLAGEKTSHMACYAFGRNPSPQVGKALRDALPAARGMALVNIINTLADRRDGESVEAIGKLAAANDPEVADAAVAALGRISGEQAAKALAQARKKGEAKARLAATLACLECAEGLAAQGKKAEATAIYDELLAAAEPQLIRRGALIGLMASGGDQATSVVLSMLRGDDERLKATAIAELRNLKGEGLTERFAAELPKLPPPVQALLIDALAGRGGPAARLAIAAAARSGSPEVKTAAVRALGRIGDAASVETLVAALAEGKTEEERNPALVSLRVLRAEGVDAAILQSLKAAKPEARPYLIQALHDRNAVGAVPALLEEAASPEAGVRIAAFKALAALAKPDDLPALLHLLIGLRGDEGRAEAERAASAAARKIAEETSRADLAVAFLGRTNPADARCSLVRVLGGVGNAKALEAVRSAVQDGDAPMQDAAVRTLANWPTAAATPALLGIFKTTNQETHRVLALRGYVRLLNLPGARPAAATLKLYGEALNAARRPEDERLILAGLRWPTPKRSRWPSPCSTMGPWGPRPRWPRARSPAPSPVPRPTTPKRPPRSSWPPRRTPPSAARLRPSSSRSRSPRTTSRRGWSAALTWRRGRTTSSFTTQPSGLRSPVPRTSSGACCPRGRIPPVPSCSTC
jgi:HEAT repeat protein